MESVRNIQRLAILLAAASYLFAADPIFLRRQVSDVKPQPDDLTAPDSKAASYKPLFGIGSRDADQLYSVARYGELTVEPGGSSSLVSYPAEEQIYFVEEGSGTLLYGDEKTPLRKNDFMYLPIGVRHGIANSSNAAIKVIVMGYKIPSGILVQSTPKLLLANADDVALQILGDHDPNTRCKRLMGHNNSWLDILAAAYEMDSLTLVDFAPFGTNFPDNHPGDVEFYLLLRGAGDLVAGLDAAGKQMRYHVTQGAAFLFNPGTDIGYYSDVKKGQPHDLMLAARSRAGEVVGGAAHRQ
jgi:mannose-6-phosphate isomerase-like protein (cupin superfamily)